MENIEILGEKTARAILKRVSTGEIKFVDKDGGIRTVRHPNPE